MRRLKAQSRHSRAGGCRGCSGTRHNNQAYFPSLSPINFCSGRWLNQRETGEGLNLGGQSHICACTAPSQRTEWLHEYLACKSRGEETGRLLPRSPRLGGGTEPRFQQQAERTRRGSQPAWPGIDTRPLE